MLGINTQEPHHLSTTISPNSRNDMVDDSMVDRWEWKGCFCPFYNSILLYCAFCRDGLAGSTNIPPEGRECAPPLLGYCTSYESNSEQIRDAPNLVWDLKSCQHNEFWKLWMAEPKLTQKCLHWITAVQIAFQWPITHPSENLTWQKWYSQHAMQCDATLQKLVGSTKIHWSLEL